MRSFFRKILEWKLKKLAQIIIWKYRPGIVGVTGNVGKTSTKLAIATVLSLARHVRHSADSHNNQVGLPLTVIGEWSPEDLALVSKNRPPGGNIVLKIMFWLRVFFRALRMIIFRADYPEILVLEYGADRPGDIKYLLTVARPNISVITAVGDIPVHVEYFSGPDEVAKEKGRLIESLDSSGHALLNADDLSVMGLQDRTRAELLTYGFGKDADFRISNFEIKIKNDLPAGINFRLSSGGAKVSFRLPQCFGKAQAYAAAAAAAVGNIFGIPLEKSAEILSSYHTADGRMNLLRGLKGSLILNDAYNASPLSMKAALDSLEHIPAKRKIGILGDMLELGRYTLEAHEALGEAVVGVLDVLITVGPRAKFIAAAAQKKGFKKIKSYEYAEDALRDIPEMVKKGDLILVKGSHAVGLDQVVEVLEVPEGFAVESEAEV